MLDISLIWERLFGLGWADDVIRHLICRQCGQCGTVASAGVQIKIKKGWCAVRICGIRSRGLIFFLRQKAFAQNNVRPRIPHIGSAPTFVFWLPLGSEVNQRPHALWLTTAPKERVYITWWWQCWRDTSVDFVVFDEF